MIQLHPPLSDEHPPPQPVAAKSLMVTSILSEDLTAKFIYIFIVCISAWTVSGSLVKGDRIFSDAYDEVTPFYIKHPLELISKDRMEGIMRYFYYGPEKAKETAAESSGQNRRQKQDDDLVIEEDTIYEIDRECEACRKRILKGQW